MTRSAPEPRLLTYLERVREIVREPLSEAGILRRVGEELEAALGGPLHLDESLRRLPEKGYGRNLLHRDPTGFVVVVVVWPPGCGGPPHDHGTWGVVGVLEGGLEITDYERQDDGCNPGHAALLEVATTRAGAGGIVSVLPPHRDFHRVRNPSDTDPALSLHTYGRDLLQCHVVGPDGRLEGVPLHYDNVVEGEATLPLAGLLQRMTTQHADIGGRMEALLGLAQRLPLEASARDWERLSTRLAELRDVLAAHFEAEERDEFFGRVARLDPPSRATVARLATQHRAFLSQIDGLLADLDPLKQGGRRFGYLIGELQNLASNLRWHDAVESGLLKRIACERSTSSQPEVEAS